MGRQPVIDWDRLGDGNAVWSQPAFSWALCSWALRDWLWLFAISGLALAWGADRWRIAMSQDNATSALTAAQAAAEHALSQQVALTEQLRSLREEQSARQQSDTETIAALRKSIAALKAESRPIPTSRRTGGQER